jgi:bifunctional non-homologous end joining protein LigD
MLATLTDGPFDDPGWVFEDKYDGFRMVAKIEDGRVALYSRNGKVISDSYIEIAKALDRVAPAPSSLQKIRLSSDGANQLNGSRNWRADGDGCDGLHLMQVAVARLEASPGEDR